MIEISISANAARQIQEIPEVDEFGWTSQVKDRIRDLIATEIGSWKPRSERGGSGVIKLCDAISSYCNADVYRLKSQREIDDWRVFFFMLDRDIPPTRHVEEIVKWESNRQCYDDMTQPHVKRILQAITRFKNADRMRLMRNYN